MALLVLLLPALSLLLMVMRVWLPFGQQTTGRPLLEVRLSWKERLLFQRSNLYALGALLVLLSATGSISFLMEIIALAVAYGILALPVRYRLTDEGVGLNRVVFRRWAEFQEVSEGARAIRLRGVAGMNDFFIRLLADHQAPVLALLRRQIAPDSSPAARKGSAPIRVKRHGGVTR